MYGLGMNDPSVPLGLADRDVRLERVGPGLGCGCSLVTALIPVPWLGLKGLLLPIAVIVVAWVATLWTRRPGTRARQTLRRLQGELDGELVLPSWREPTALPQLVAAIGGVQTRIELTKRPDGPLSVGLMSVASGAAAPSLKLAMYTSQRFPFVFTVLPEAIRVDAIVGRLQLERIELPPALGSGLAGYARPAGEVSAWLKRPGVAQAMSEVVIAHAPVGAQLSLGERGCTLLTLVDESVGVSALAKAVEGLQRLERLWKARVRDRLKNGDN